MSLKILGFAAILASAAACGPPTPVYYSGEAVMEVEAEPPAPQVEVRPAVPYPNAVWLEGHWYWRGRWEWVPGHWAAHRPGWVWVPHHWARGPRHWRYVPGHWQRV